MLELLQHRDIAANHGASGHGRLLGGILLALLEFSATRVLNRVVLANDYRFLRLRIEFLQQKAWLPLKILDRGFRRSFQYFNVNVLVFGHRNAVDDFNGNRRRMVTRDFEALPCLFHRLLGDDAALPGLRQLIANRNPDAPLPATLPRAPRINPIAHTRSTLI